MGFGASLPKQGGSRRKGSEAVADKRGESPPKFVECSRRADKEGVKSLRKLLKTRSSGGFPLPAKVAGGLLVFAMLIGGTFNLMSQTSARAASVEPEFIAGNPSCDSLGYYFDGYKPNPAAGEDDPTGTYTITYTYAGVTYTAGQITVTENGAGTGIDWQSTFPISAVIVKGGPNANLYTYNPPAPSYGDTGLVTPDNNGSPYGLSHVEFCFGGAEAPNADLTVVKTAEASYTETHTWDITKAVTPAVINMFTGDSAEVQYTVTVDETVTESDFLVTGDITISNDGFINAEITSVIDYLDDNTNATVSCPQAVPFVLAPFSEVTCTYTATPDDASATLNTARVAYTDDNEDFDAPEDGTAAVAWTPTIVGYDQVNVDDTNGASWLFTGDDSVNYNHTFTCDSDEGSNGNTATIVETGQSASASVQVDCYDLTVSKDATTTYTQTWNWTIDKSADATTLTLSEGQQQLVNYAVEVDATATDSDWAVNGTITVNNPAPIDAELTTVADIVSPDIAATVSCGVAFPYTLTAGGTLTCSYSASLPDASTRTNTATASLQNYDYDVAGGATASGTTGFTGSAAVAFGAASTVIDECIEVSDTNVGILGTVCAGGVPQQFSYAVWFSTMENADVVLECGENTHVNVASFVTNDTGATGSDSWTVNANVACNEGCTLTQGYWKTHSLRGPAPYDDAWLAIGPLGADTPFFLSGKTYYQVLWTPPAGNAYYNLAHQYIAAKLNVLNGASAPAEVTAAIAAADTFFNTYTPAQAAGLKGAARNAVLSNASLLDRFNNGLIGPGHCTE